MSQVFRRDPPWPDRENYEQLFALGRNKRRSIDHRVGAPRNDWRRRKSFWRLQAPRKNYEIMAVAVRRQYQRPMAPVAGSSVWGTVADTDSTWSAGSAQDSTWTTDTATNSIWTAE